MFVIRNKKTGKCIEIDPYGNGRPYEVDQDKHAHVFSTQEALDEYIKKHGNKDWKIELKSNKK